jgi:hypothetical protein
VARKSQPLLGLGIVSLACIVTACGTNVSPKPVAPHGFITGTADMCSGAPGQPPHNVQARLLQDNRIVGHQTYPGNHAFRFSVAPGRYTVTSDQSYAALVHVKVSPGETVHVEDYSSCS